MELTEFARRIWLGEIGYQCEAALNAAAAVEYARTAAEQLHEQEEAMSRAHEEATKLHLERVRSHFAELDEHRSEMDRRRAAGEHVSFTDSGWNPPPTPPPMPDRSATIAEGHRLQVEIFRNIRAYSPMRRTCPRCSGPQILPKLRVSVERNCGKLSAFQNRSCARKSEVAEPPRPHGRTARPISR